jgi:cell division septum initiation protein DivIVA
MGPNLMQLEKEYSQFQNEIEKTQNLIKNLENELNENRQTVKLQNDMIKMTDTEIKSIMDPSNDPISETIQLLNQQQKMTQMLGAIRTTTPPDEKLRKII